MDRGERKGGRHLAGGVASQKGLERSERTELLWGMFVLASLLSRGACHDSPTPPDAG